MILCRLFQMIRFAISLLLPADKPKKECTIDDVKAALAEKAKAIGEPLDWEHSVVDLCKLLDFDPSFGARQDMYVKAGGASQYEGTSEQNIWLHSHVMAGLAEHGFAD